MTAPRIIIDGDEIEIAGRFSSEAEIDAFFERLWTVWFALQPAQADAKAEAPPASEGARFVGKSVEEISEQIGEEVVRPGPVSHETVRADPPETSADELARLTPSERRVILLMREKRDAQPVADAMGIGVATVYFHIKNAKKKGVTP